VSNVKINSPKVLGVVILGVMTGGVVFGFGLYQWTEANINESFQQLMASVTLMAVGLSGMLIAPVSAFRTTR